MYGAVDQLEGMINRIKKEKKHRDTITKYQETVYDEKIGDTGVNIKTTSKSSDDMFLTDNIE